MKAFFENHLQRKMLIFGLLLVMVVFVGSVSATTYTSPNIDGTISTTNDWDSDENLGSSGPSGTGDPQLWLTWDATNLYIGIEGDPDTAIQIFFDTAAGGATQDTNEIYTIANAGGYEYAWRVPQGTNHNASRESWFTYDGTPWNSGVLASTAGIISAYGLDLELVIPWTSLGFATTPNTRLGILVTMAPTLLSTTMNNYWPNVAGNSTTAFSQQFIFSNAGTSGVVTGTSPTAVSLQTFTAANNPTNMIFVAAFAVVAFGVFFIVARRKKN